MNKNLVPDLSSRELQAVCAIAEEGSFLAAAIVLELSQPALTRALQRVEAAMGVELFRRSTRKVEITPAGQEFVALANRILADLRISFEGMREIADEQRGQVIISTVMSVACTRPAPRRRTISGVAAAHRDPGEGRRAWHGDR